METYRFLLQGHWNGGRLGYGHLKAGQLDSAVSIDSQMGGPGVGTNPEDLLLAAAANCYMITLGALLERRSLGIVRFELNSEATVTRDGGKIQFRSIVHRPKLVVSEKSEENLEQARQCAIRAEKACMVSQALHGNVEVTVEPVVE